MPEQSDESKSRWIIGRAPLHKEEPNCIQHIESALMECEVFLCEGRTGKSDNLQFTLNVKLSWKY